MICNINVLINIFPKKEKNEQIAFLKKKKVFYVHWVINKIVCVCMCVYTCVFVYVRVCVAADRRVSFLQKGKDLI